MSQRGDSIAKCTTEHAREATAARSRRGNVIAPEPPLLQPRQDPVRTVKSSKSAELRPKKKCCRSKPRCKRCPLVVHKVLKDEHMGIRGKELEKVYKRARKT